MSRFRHGRHPQASSTFRCCLRKPSTYTHRKRPPALYKQRAYSMEQEVRVLRYREQDFNNADKDQTFTLPPSWPPKWDPEAIIDRIVINPYCPSVYPAIAQNAIHRLSPILADKVVKSELAAVALY